MRVLFTTPRGTPIANLIPLSFLLLLLLIIIIITINLNNIGKNPWDGGRGGHNNNIIEEPLNLGQWEGAYNKTAPWDQKYADEA
jgi:hypothetical protein